MMGLFSWWRKRKEAKAAAAKADADRLARQLVDQLTALERAMDEREARQAEVIAPKPPEVDTREKQEAAERRRRQNRQRAITPVRPPRNEDDT